MGSVFALLLVLLNCWQYGLFESDTGAKHGRSKDAAMPASQIRNINSSIIADIKTHSSYPVVRNLFSLSEPEPKARPVEKAAKETDRQPPPKVVETTADPADLFKVLAVSRHSTGVSALISYQGSTTTVKVGDVFAEKYRVTAIESNRVMLEVWEQK